MGWDPLVSGLLAPNDVPDRTGPPGSSTGAHRRAHRRQRSGDLELALDSGEESGHGGRVRTGPSSRVDLGGCGGLGSSGTRPATRLGGGCPQTSTAMGFSNAGLDGRKRVRSRGARGTCEHAWRAKRAFWTAAARRTAATELRLQWWSGLRRKRRGASAWGMCPSSPGARRGGQ